MFKLKNWLAGIALLVASFGAQAFQSTIYASAIRTASSVSADVVRTTERGVSFIINMTVVPGVDTVTFTIQGKDNLGNYYTLLASAALVGTGVVVLSVCPGCAVTANVSASAILPDVYRIITTHSAGTSFTYTVTENNTP